MKTTDLYRKYDIMPQLAEHQLTVAGVACLLCDSSKQFVDKRTVIEACLFYAMADIIKFDLSRAPLMFPGKFSPEQLDKWGKVKQDFISRYGLDERLASLAVAREIGLSGESLKLISRMSLAAASHDLESFDFAPKICLYAYMRVAPGGVRPLAERIADLKNRYSEKLIEIDKQSGQVEFETVSLKLEKQIFWESNIQPQDVTEEAVVPYVEQLRNYSFERSV